MYGEHLTIRDKICVNYTELKKASVCKYKIILKIKIVLLRNNDYDIQVITLRNYFDQQNVYCTNSIFAGQLLIG